MKASEYQVSVSPNLTDFKWDERGQTSLDWPKFKNNFLLIQNLDIHSTNHHHFGSQVIPPSSLQVSAFAHKFENLKFIEFLHSDRVNQISKEDAYFTDEELRSGNYISVSEYIWRAYHEG
jgi:hypothetical protein